MVRVGITGCDNLRAAELVRILINHPDVDLMWVKSTAYGTMRLDQIVPGIVGECGLTINPEGELGEVDVLFMCGAREQYTDTFNALRLNDNVRIIDLSDCHNLEGLENESWQYGLSEMQRRVLVHGTGRATIPGAAAMASVLSLLPLAHNLMLNSPLALQVAVGALAFPDKGRTIDGLDETEWAAQQQREIEAVLKQCQPGFAQPVSLTLSPHDGRRTITVTVQLKCDIGEQQVRQLYDQYYDDHNFVFIVDRPIVTADIENTNKCLIHLSKNELTGMLTVQSAIDLLIKGSSGNAVHVMNLMFGLHERAGLALKGTGC
jgi:N-acetyl-gamma-glutamyl-phosphate reductase